MPDRSTAVVLLTVGIALAVASGVGPVPGADDSSRTPDAERLVSEMLSDEPRSVEGTFYEVVRQNDSALDVTVYNVTMRPPSEKQRVEIVRSDMGNLTVVQNDTTAWIYNDADNEFVQHDFGQSERGIVIPALRYEHYENLLETFNVSYAGVEQVAGREAHVVVFTDPTDESRTASIDLVVGDTQYQLATTSLEEPLVLSEHRLWIDTTHDYPIKRQTTLIGQDGESVTYTSRYEWIDFEPDEQTDTFQFDPPEGAESRDAPDIQSEEYDSIDAAASALPYPVPDPDVPSAYQLRTVDVYETNGTKRVRIRYSDGANNLSVGVYPGFDHEIEGMGVSVGDRTGTLTRGQGRTSVYWECANRTYTIAADSGTISVETHLAVAESIACG
ncbi:MAG: outer membrane lipoprotein carrier protein LolA [Haloarculaceae archaeon]